MNVQRDRMTEHRRFLAINFRVGTGQNSYLVGPVLVSTRDYVQFHFWDEPFAAEFDLDGYEIIKLYPRDMSYDEASRQFTKDFAPSLNEPQAAGWRLPTQATLTGKQHIWVGRRVISA